MLLVLFRCCKSVDSRQITHAGLLPLLICDARFADTATLTAVQKPHGLMVPVAQNPDQA